MLKAKVFFDFFNFFFLFFFWGTFLQINENSFLDDFLIKIIVKYQNPSIW